MPSLSPSQFWQTQMPVSSSGTLPPRATPAPVDPIGPPLKRGKVGEGQMALNFDQPDLPLTHAEGGLVPADAAADPDYWSGMYNVGGRQRVYPRDRSAEFPKKGDVSEQITHAWESAPVEMIGPDDEVRTGQARQTEGTPTQISHSPGKAERIRQAGEEGLTWPDTGQDQFPWIAQVGDKRYLLEGHHRLIAGRRRGDGFVPAHVIRGESFADITRQITGR